MRGDHRHCPCNGVWLCSTCHKWAHANPGEARRRGFIVSRYEEHPWSIVVEAHYGALLLECDGTVGFSG